MPLRLCPPPPCRCPFFLAILSRHHRLSNVTTILLFSLRSSTYYDFLDPPFPRCYLVRGRVFDPPPPPTSLPPCLPKVFIYSLGVFPYGTVPPLPGARGEQFLSWVFVNSGLTDPPLPSFTHVVWQEVVGGGGPRDNFTSLLDRPLLKLNRTKLSDFPPPATRITSLITKLKTVHFLSPFSPV